MTLHWYAMLSWSVGTKIASARQQEEFAEARLIEMNLRRGETVRAYEYKKESADESIIAHSEEEEIEDAVDAVGADAATTAAA